MPRNRLKTESRILEAALRILRRDGFSGWGINPVAREAGVDKVLIYRYFDGIEGLLDAVVSRVPFWPEAESLPRRSPEAWLEGTLAHLVEHPEILVLLSLPGSHKPASIIGQKQASDLNGWLEGFASHVEGNMRRDILEMLPAILLYQAATGSESWSTADLCRQLVPGLVWRRNPDVAEESDELPTELL